MEPVKDNLSVGQFIERQRSINELMRKKVSIENYLIKLKEELLKNTSEIVKLINDLEAQCPGSKELFDVVSPSEPAPTKKRKERTLKHIHHKTFIKILKTPLTPEELKSNLKKDDSTLTDEKIETSIEHFIENKKLLEKGGMISWIEKKKK